MTIRVIAAAVGRAVRTVLGAPDYEAYRAHMDARHPGVTPASPEEFARERLEHRYSRPGSRCC